MWSIRCPGPNPYEPIKILVGSQPLQSRRAGTEYTEVTYYAVAQLSSGYMSHQCFLAGLEESSKKKPFW